MNYHDVAISRVSDNEKYANSIDLSITKKEKNNHEYDEVVSIPGISLFSGARKSTNIQLFASEKDVKTKLKYSMQKSEMKPKLNRNNQLKMPPTI